MRERMSRPSSSLPNQCAADGPSRRAGRLIDAGSCGAIHGANTAKTTNVRISTTPIAASGLWRACPAIERPDEMEALDIGNQLCREVLRLPGDYVLIRKPPAWTVRMRHNLHHQLTFKGGK